MIGRDIKCARTIMCTPSRLIRLGALAHPRPPARAWGFKSCTAATSNRARVAKGHTESVGRSVPRDAQMRGRARLRGEHREKAGFQTRLSDHRPAYRYHRARRAQQGRTPFASLVSPLECPYFGIRSRFPPNAPCGSLFAVFVSHRTPRVVLSSRSSFQS